MPTAAPVFVGEAGVAECRVQMQPFIASSRLKHPSLKRISDDDEHERERVVTTQPHARGSPAQAPQTPA